MTKLTLEDYEKHLNEKLQNYNDLLKECLEELVPIPEIYETRRNFILDELKYIDCFKRDNKNLGDLK